MPMVVQGKRAVSTMPVRRRPCGVRQVNDETKRFDHYNSLPTCSTTNTYLMIIFVHDRCPITSDMSNSFNYVWLTKSLSTTEHAFDSGKQSPSALPFHHRPPCSGYVSDDTMSGCRRDLFCPGLVPPW